MSICLFLLLFSGCGTLQRSEKRLASDIFIPLRNDSLQIVDSTLRTLGRDYLTRNSLGNWELYVQGEPQEIGTKIGVLSKDLYQAQERIFATKLFELVPTKSRQKTIMRFVKWYNRKLDRYIPQEYLNEIYALSNSLDTSYNYLGTPYERTLWMHGAHDIGHVLQDLALVGCSSFAVWGEKTQDGKLLVGRNLDFYMNDEFAQNKIIYFIKPSEGHPYISVSWPGMVGVLSGMNREGLTVTLNAGKSTIPLSAKTPISIIAKEVLQYASNIQEALAILAERKVFVSESLLISSAHDRRAILVEMTPKKMDVVSTLGNTLISTNHFQGELLRNNRRNKKHIDSSHSMYRFEKLRDLLDTTSLVTPQNAVAILRNTDGQDNEKLGFGNDKSLNHMLAHHGVIFQPEDRVAYVSSAPGQMGAYKMYDLRMIFDDNLNIDRLSQSMNSQDIQADSFLRSSEYENFKAFQKLCQYYLKKIDERHIAVNNDELKEYVALNPDLWLGYYIAGRLMYLQKDYERAKVYFELAESKVLPTIQVKKDIEKQLKKVSKEWKRKY